MVKRTRSQGHSYAVTVTVTYPNVTFGTLPLAVSNTGICEY